MVLTPLVRGLLGIDVDAPARRVTIAPHLPPEWDFVAVDRVPIGNGHFSFDVRRSTGRMSITVTRHGDVPPFELTFSPGLPLGARITTPAAAVQPTPGDVHASVKATVVGPTEIDISYSGGWSIVAPSVAAQIGQRSRAPRVLSERLIEGRYTVSLEGIAGQTYAFRILTADATTARQLSIEVPGSAGASLSQYVAGTAERGFTVTFPRAEPNADGYTSMHVRFAAPGR
jgi:hypothetical protein